MPRRACLSHALVVLLPLVGCHAPASPPNVVLISVDCLNHRQLDEAVRAGWTPAIAELARDSLAFSRAYAHAPWTTPSHMSMLSGLYPAQHGRDIAVALAANTQTYQGRVPAFETLADRLAARGYETVAFVGTGSISARFGLGQGFAQYHEAEHDG